MADAVAALAARPAAEFSRGRLVLADGTVFEGLAFGAGGDGIGEVCFNTAMTGYQEILTDPSYAGQIVCFTFPHIGIVGTNAEDIEALTPVVRGLIVRADAEQPSNYRALSALDAWLKKHNIPALAGIDTRALTNRIREKGMPHGAITRGDTAQGLAAAKSFPGLVGLDLAKEVTSRQSYKWREMPWAWHAGYGELPAPSWRVTAVDFGVKRNMLRILAGLGADITVVPGAGESGRGAAAQAGRRAFVQRPGRSGGDGDLCDPDHQGRDRCGHPDLRHLPGPSDAGPGAGRADAEDGPGPSRRQPFVRSRIWRPARSRSCR